MNLSQQTPVYAFPLIRLLFRQTIPDCFQNDLAGADGR